MSRLSRIIAPGYPHHIIQRGNRRQQTFFCDEDYSAYIKLTSEWCRKCNVEVWSYCLMPNHVHLIAVQENEDGLRRAFGEAHRRYTNLVNTREKWTGYLWQGRFKSYVLANTHLLMAARYIEMNPVKSNMVHNPKEWRWSSAKAHLEQNNDRLCTVLPLLEIAGIGWELFLQKTLTEEQIETLCRCERTGRPAGNKEFVVFLERMLHRPILPRKRGPKSKVKTENN